jgi:peroxiredoxin
VNRRARYVLIVVVLLASVALAAEPGKSAHGPAFNAGPRRAATLTPGTGVVTFPVTTMSPQARAFITQGVGLLHGFWYVEAERAFRQAAMLDPDCAMAYWGMAFANFDNEPRAKEFIAEAKMQADKATPRERAYIDALDRYFNASNRDAADRRRDLATAYESIAHKFPADLEAKAFLVWQLWDNHQHGAGLGSRLAVDALVGEILAVEPRHPAHHYRIHVNDGPNGDQARALASAAACGPVAPAVPHMWHMPGHIYVNAKRYADAAWQMEAALRLEHAHLTRLHLTPDESHLYVHNRGWLVDNLEYAGQVRDAIDLCKQAIELPRHPGYKEHVAACRKLIDILVRHERWEELRALENSPYCEPTDDRGEQARRLVAFGRADLARGDRSAAIERLTKLIDLFGECRRDIATGWEQAYGPNHLAGVIAATWAAGAAASPTEFAADLLAADRALRKSPGTSEPALRPSAPATLGGRFETLRNLEQSAAELRGHVALANGGAKAALELFTRAGDVGPDVRAAAYLTDGDLVNADEATRDAGGRVYRLANRVDLLQRLGKASAARTAFAELRRLAGTADLDDPPLARLTPLAASLALPPDWRTPIARPDVGQRPPLDSFGPFRWQPWLAPDWALPDADGRSVRLADHRGKPVVVIFYLGIGCVHCVEQLTAFAPKARDFAAAGIDVIAIGTDTVDTLKGADADGKYPFTVLSDTGTTAFRAFGAYDDFERLPLHGTFLVDAAGRVRWQDIGSEPFNDPDFLLAEAKRLLKVAVNSR